MADFIPGPDAAFNAWQANFVTYASANLAGLGLVAGDMTPVTNAQTAWSAAYPAHVAAQQAAQAATQTKKNARDAYIAALRPLTRRLQASGLVDAAEKASLGITVPDTEPTPVGPPTSRPIAQVDVSQRLRHGIAFRDETTPSSQTAGSPNLS